MAWWLGWAHSLRSRKALAILLIDRTLTMMEIHS